MDPLTHASFFSGAGGLDHGLERAGWTTLSLAEIDPYACAVLAERFPGVTNLGDITTIDPEDIPDATLWSGGFPCQDLSKAGKRRGFGGDRSVLAFAFLDLVERRRPRWFILENVDGLLTSNDGRDLARLVGEVDGLGYGLAWRVLDAQWFGVAQRRRRVFIVASRDSDRAGAILLEPDLSRGHPPPIVEARTTAARDARGRPGGSGGPNIVRQAISAKWSKGYSGPAGDEHHNLVLVASPRTTRPYDDRGDIASGLVLGSPLDAARVREADGLAGRLDDRPPLVADNEAQAGHLIAVAGRGGQGDTVPIVAFRKARKARSPEDDERWEPADFTDTISPMTMDSTAIVDRRVAEDPELLPVGIDTHRYRLTGNGVVSPVAEWIGRRLAEEAAP
ncbi:MAG: DNA (cytosine-5-)-methyltransferase [Chloroflexi bacterium]|nr:DNA (cytosine-5-)-methyltransferase [Chloroflexota bacterium]